MPPRDPIEIPDRAPEDAVDALYGLPLDEFTPRRDELVKELRGAGKRDEAAWVKALRKPSATAWLVNQLARRDQKLEPGMLVFSGGLTEPIPMQPRMSVTAELDQLGAVEVYTT